MPSCASKSCHHEKRILLMKFDQENKVIQLCAKGMELEGQGRLIEAGNLFDEAWNKASTDFEKLTAAHYVARHQKSITDKLKWDQIALKHALEIGDETIKATLPSLFLNVGKCYEDLNEPENAKTNYEFALSFATYLSEDGYGRMIKAGIKKGLDRINEKL